MAKLIRERQKISILRRKTYDRIDSWFEKNNELFPIIPWFQENNNGHDGSDETEGRNGRQEDSVSPEDRC
jgi:hypothetical protein